MSTMLPFTSTDLLFAVVAVGALILLSVVVYALARYQQPARFRMAMIPVEPEDAVAAATVQSAPHGTIQHA